MGWVVKGWLIIRIDFEKGRRTGNFFFDSIIRQEHKRVLFLFSLDMKCSFFESIIKRGHKRVLFLGFLCKIHIWTTRLFFASFFSLLVYRFFFLPRFFSSGLSVRGRKMMEKGQVRNRDLQEQGRRRSPRDGVEAWQQSGPRMPRPGAWWR